MAVPAACLAAGPATPATALHGAASGAGVAGVSGDMPSDEKSTFSVSGSTGTPSDEKSCLGVSNGVIDERLPAFRRARWSSYSRHGSVEVRPGADSYSAY